MVNKFITHTANVTFRWALVVRGPFGGRFWADLGPETRELTAPVAGKSQSEQVGSTLLRCGLEALAPKYFRNSRVILNECAFISS